MTYHNVALHRVWADSLGHVLRTRNHFTGRMLLRSVLLTVALVCRGGPLASAAIVPGYFFGPGQTFSGMANVSGTMAGTGGGVAFNPVTKQNEPFDLIAPTTHALSLLGGPVSVSSNPQSAGYAAFDVVGGQINGLTGLNLNILNGAGAYLGLDTITVHTSSNIGLLKSVDIDVAGTLASLVFQQTGAALFSPGAPGSGTFSISGSLAAAMPDLMVTVFGLINIPAGLQQLNTPITLSGSYEVTGPDNDPKIILTSDSAYSLPLNLLTTLSTTFAAPLSLSVSAGLDVAASIDLNLRLHLEQLGIPTGLPGSVDHFKNGVILTFDAGGQPQFTPIVPEPASIVLLGAGVLAIAFQALSRQRRVFRGR